ncbi:MAG: transmembrane sensor [Cyclobacteriaceae bacterium]|jgi:transmembrane sensor
MKLSECVLYKTMNIQDRIMDYRSYTTSDFYNDESFQSYVLGLSQQDTVFWVNWLSENPKKIKEAELAKELLTSFSIGTLQIDKNIFNQDIERLKASLGQTRKNKVVPMKRTSQILLRVAASIVLVMSIGYSIQYLNSTEKQELDSVTIMEKSNPKGRKSTVMLPDGSTVKLNAESHLKYEEADNRRNVYLVGEAFFEVAEDAAKPFTVFCKEISTTALGTSFNVRSYPEDLITQVYLKTGSVEVRQFESSQKEKLTLAPGDGVEYSALNKTLVLTKLEPEMVLAWNDNTIKFESADFNQVRNKLERWFGVEIEVIGKPDSAWRISGAFKNESLENILTSIDFTAPLEYKISNNEVKIKF